MLPEYGIFICPVHCQTLGGGDDEPARVDDDARALTVVFQMGDALTEGVEREVGADRTGKGTVLVVVGGGDGDDHLLRHGVLIGLGEERFARRLRLLVPVAPARVDRREVPVVPTDEASVLRAVCEVEDVLVVGGETHHPAIHYDGIAVVCREEVCGTLGLLFLLYEPAVEIVRLDVQECVDLPRGALDESLLRLVVTDPTDHCHEQCHERPHQEQFLFNAQNPLSFS